MSEEIEVFKKLSGLNVNDKTEKKNNLTYLSWAWAWGITKENYPSLGYEVVKYEGKPYLYDNDLGYLVTTIVTINGESLPMNLPVLDGANKAMKNTGYTYKVKDWDASEREGKNVMKDKDVLAATMFDINTAIMRCLTKNLALFGLGHYIYAGEDMPQEVKERPMSINDLNNILELFTTEAELNKFYIDNQKTLSKNAVLIAEFAKRKKQIQS